MSNLNGFSFSFSMPNNDTDTMLRVFVRFLLDLKVELEYIHICTENSVMFYSNKDFKFFCPLVVDRFFDSAMIQFSQIKSSPTKKLLVKSSSLSKQDIDRFNTLKSEVSLTAISDFLKEKAK